MISNCIRKHNVHQKLLLMRGCVGADWRPWREIKHDAAIRVLAHLRKTAAVYSAQDAYKFTRHRGTTLLALSEPAHRLGCSFFLLPSKCIRLSLQLQKRLFDACADNTRVKIFIWSIVLKSEPFSLP